MTTYVPPRRPILGVLGGGGGDVSDVVCVMFAANSAERFLRVTCVSWSHDQAGRVGFFRVVSLVFVGGCFALPAVCCCPVSEGGYFRAWLCCLWVVVSRFALASLRCVVVQCQRGVVSVLGCVGGHDASALACFPGFRPPRRMPRAVGVCFLGLFGRSLGCLL